MGVATDRWITLTLTLTDDRRGNDSVPLLVRMRRDDLIILIISAVGLRALLKQLDALEVPRGEVMVRHCLGRQRL